MKTKLLVAVGVCALLTAKVNATTVNLAFETGTPQTTTALTGFVTTGAMMNGMLVTAYFGAVSETIVWNAYSATVGAVYGTGWSMMETGDTFGGQWFLANERHSNLTRLVIDAGAGNSVFDTRAIGDVEGTTGSARGMDFTVTSVTAVDADEIINVTYHGSVGLGANAPVGDLYRYMDITFSDGLDYGTLLGFNADTDNILFAGDIQAVPEATSTLGSFGVAFLALLGMARRRNR